MAMVVVDDNGNLEEDGDCEPQRAAGGGVRDFVRWRPTAAADSRRHHRWWHHACKIDPSAHHLGHQKPDPPPPHRLSPCPPPPLIAHRVAEQPAPPQNPLISAIGTFLGKTQEKTLIICGRRQWQLQRVQREGRGGGGGGGG